MAVLGDNWQHELGERALLKDQEDTASSSHLSSYPSILVLIAAACLGLYCYNKYMIRMPGPGHGNTQSRLTEAERRQQREQMAMAAAARAKKNGEWQQQQQQQQTAKTETEKVVLAGDESPPKKLKLTDVEEETSMSMTTSSPHHPHGSSPGPARLPVASSPATKKELGVEPEDDQKPVPTVPNVTLDMAVDIREKRMQAISIMMEQQQQQIATKEAAVVATITVPLQDHSSERSTAVEEPSVDKESTASTAMDSKWKQPASSSSNTRNEKSLLVETSTAAATAAETSVKAIIKKTKRKRLVVPPPQILVEALSQVFKCQVTVESRVQEGTWGGEAWRKRPTVLNYVDTTTVVTLRLQKPKSFASTSNDNDNDIGVDKDNNVKDEWKALCQVFPAVLEAALSTSLVGSKLLRKDIRNAVVFHVGAKAVAKNGFTTLLMKGDEGFDELKVCMDILCQWLVKQVATWIRPEVLRGMDNDDDDDDYDEGDDLFSNDYDTDTILPVAAPSTVGKLDSLFGLLEEAVSVVTSDFLEDLFRCYETMVVKAEEEKKGMQLCEYFWNQVLSRLAAAQHTKSFSGPTVTRRIFGVTNLLTASPSVCESLAQSLQKELNQAKGKNGKEIKELIRLAPLFEAVAYSVPAAGTEAKPSSIPGGFLQQLELIEDYPTSVFISKRGDATGKVMGEARRAIKAARTAAESVLRLAFKTGDKETVFQWLGCIVSSNKELVNLLKADLLESGGVVALSSSRSFLLGLTSTLISFCGTSLRTRLDKMGADAFNPAYLDSSVAAFAHEHVEDRNRLFQGSERSTGERAEPQSSEFAGATHLFFLSCLFLRVAIHPALRMEAEFLYFYNKVLTSLQDAAKSENALAPNSLDTCKSVVASWLGWKTFLEDPDLASNLTDFALTRLGWLVAVAQKKDTNLTMIPGWMCKEPALWLSHLAKTSPFLLTPIQAEKAVEYATMLLDLGGSSSNPSEEDCFSFSPVVLTALIEIASGFVEAGVRLARDKQRHRHNRGRGRADDPSELDEPDDDRGLDVYLSFDKNDLGVTVFTNQIVREKLCPTLLRTFRAVDVIEGLDADRDDSFSKFSAKSQIAELLLRLWSHPAGDCRESFAAVPSGEILSFASSLASVVAVDFDFASGALENVRMSANDRPTQPTAQRTQKAYLDQSISQAVGMFQQTRRFLALLCTISQEERIARCLGGYSSDDAFDTRQIADLSNMIVHLLDKLTSEDGGTNPSLEEVNSEPSSLLLSRCKNMLASEKAHTAADVVRRRITTKMEYGLDVSVLCHKLLALAAKWHLTAVATAANSSRNSPLLAFLAESEDCDIVRMCNVYRRMVTIPERTEGTETENAATIFEHDGYVDHSTWKHNYIDPKVSEVQKRNRLTSGQDQMKHSDIAKVASNDDISLFLDDLRAKMADRKRTLVDPSEIPKMEASILSGGATLREDEYGESLSEWLVSSEPFSIGKDGKKFAHKYDAIARKRTLSGSGKTLVKEAKKCHKGLPDPSANAATFVCFAEERMDLCRAVVTGPVDTPYAHGLFVFDVYFPPAYPQVAPMITFMTTGGGRVRFNPNLYVDGKVCISLLGSTNATDESQRWNPDLSSLAQVLISIQSQILGVGDPYFNEGNGVPEMMRRTPAGRAGSYKYNNTVRLANMRYAMVEHLRSPPKGFEEVTMRHFSMCRGRIVAQARRWMLEAHGTGLYSRYERTYAELLTLLAEKSMHKYDSLPPLREDLEALEKLDPSFGQMVDTSKDDGDQKMQARETSTGTGDSLPVPGFNPWAVPAARQVLATNPSRDAVADDDDELYS